MILLSLFSPRHLLFPLWQGIFFCLLVFSAFNSLLQQPLLKKEELLIPWYLMRSLFLPPGWLFNIAGGCIFQNLNNCISAN